MQLKLILLLCAFSISSCSINAQKESTAIQTEERLVRQTIEMYFDGWTTSDTTKLGKAMHSTCKLKNIKDDQVLVHDRSKYLSFFKPGSKKKVADCRIVKIDITDNIAPAKCEIETPSRLFTDYFNMMKLGDDWYIVDKIATNSAR